MLREPDRLVNALRRACDALALLVAFALAFWLRFLSGLVAAPAGDPPWESYARAAPAALVLALVAFGAAGLYRRRAVEPARDEALAVLRGCALALVLVLAAASLYRDESYSRLFALGLAGTLPAAALAGRALLRAGLARRARARFGRRRAVVVGAEPARGRALALLARHAEEGVEVVATLDADPPPDDLAEQVRGARADEVLIALPPERLALVGALDRALGDVPVDVHVALDLGALTTLRPAAGDLHGLPLLTLRRGPYVGLDGLGKRAFDVVAGGALLVLAAPLLLALGLLVRLTSPGPALYRQERVGWGGRRFFMLKLRTMRHDAEGPTRTLRDDPRRTRLGALLRRTSLDELPQLWNVLRGDMSLVGPRPERVEHFPELERRLPGFMLRHAVPAGMTGWAQVHGLRGDAPVEERLRYDLEYIQRWSPWLDLRILLLTCVRGFAHPNAF
ncbi:MAG: exopolysaccharide biosynthesis polyprenyl glycosylphosphotransferase [Planctomycetes bacterium]|nr:exopolysaccharide biosynthesis polyprenyl glycosylphosphotransferase [Planctomycetota bacterium]